MGRVDHTSLDPTQELFNQLAALRKLVRRVSGKPTRVPITSGSGTAFTLSEDDGNIWVDVDDGTLHWVVNGIEFQVSGTQV
jgi:hypothetical protein